MKPTSPPTRCVSVARHRRGMSALLGLVTAVALGTVLGAPTSVSAAVISVTLDGPSPGHVVSDPPGIDCSNVPGAERTDCSFDFPLNFEGIQFSATPAIGAAFFGWSGTAGGTCTGGSVTCRTDPVFFTPFAVAASFAPIPDAPLVATGTATDVSFPTAKFNGTVNPNSDSFPTSDCYFEYGLTSDYGRRVACSPRKLGPGAADEEVSATTGKLEPGKAYHYRLVAKNGGGVSYGADHSFQSDAVDDSCPNAEIRAEQGLAAQALPHCLAYEMVSPVNTRGQRASTQLLSADGDQLILSSVGGFAGTLSLSQTGSYYVALRGASGWAVKAIAPPASEFPYSVYSAFDFSGDLSRSLWYVNRKADEGTFRFTTLRREGDGTFLAAAPPIDGLGSDSAFGITTVGSSESLNRVVLLAYDRPPLTDNTVDTRLQLLNGARKESLYSAVRNQTGGIELSQIAYRSGATMFPECTATLMGSNANSGATARGSVSRNASKVFFTFRGSPPNPCQAATTQRVWAKVGDDDPIDLATSQCTPTTPDTCAPQRATFEGASRDGSRVYFTTEQKLLDSDQDTSKKSDLYEYDFDAPVGTRLRSLTASAAAAGAGVVRASRVSEDGSHVYFVANGRPLAGANARGIEPQSGAQNLYVYRRASGAIRFIGALSSQDSYQWAADSDSRKFEVSPDGRFALFQSAADLSGDRLSGDLFPDMFRYDDQTGQLRRVWTTDPAHNGSSRVAGPVMVPTKAGPNNGGLQLGWPNVHMPDDGSMVGFNTAEPLSPDDVNDQEDAYLWEADTGEITLLTSGRGATPARFNRMSADGNSMTVQTSAPLLPEHTAGSVAAFVLRKNGGFKRPAVDDRGPCVGDACQGPGDPGPPPLGVGGTPSFVGPGNLVFKDPPKSVAKVRVTKPKRVRGTSTRLTVRVPAAGGIRVSGSGLRRGSRTAQKAGSYRVAARLSKRGARKLQRSGRVRVRVTIRFAPRGGRSSRARVSLTFKKKKAKRLRASSRSSIHLSSHTKGR